MLPLVLDLMRESAFVGILEFQRKIEEDDWVSVLASVGDKAHKVCAHLAVLNDGDAWRYWRYLHKVLLFRFFFDGFVEVLICIEQFGLDLPTHGPFPLRFGHCSSSVCLAAKGLGKLQACPREGPCVAPWGHSDSRGSRNAGSGNCTSRRPSSH